MYIVAFEGPEYTGCFGASYHGPFESEFDAQMFVEGGGGDPEHGGIALILELEGR